MYGKIFVSADLWTKKIDQVIFQAVLNKDGTKGGINATVKEFVRFLRNLYIHASHFETELVCFLFLHLSFYCFFI